MSGLSMQYTIYKFKEEKGESRCNWIAAWLLLNHGFRLRNNSGSLVSSIFQFVWQGFEMISEVSLWICSQDWRCKNMYQFNSSCDRYFSWKYAQLSWCQARVFWKLKTTIHIHRTSLAITEKLSGWIVSTRFSQHILVGRALAS